jgi:Flp pilus assembly protein TadB
MRNLGLNPPPASRGERVLLVVAVTLFAAAMVWFWYRRPETWALGAIFIVWLMLVSAALAIVRIAAYRRRARAREKFTEQVAEALAGRARE